MTFQSFNELVNQVNTTLGDFCNVFGLRRKELAGLGKVPKRGILFKLDSDERDWVINEGGGIEVQYHLAFDESELEVKYGLGFNTKYVPFANQKTPVQYMQPFMRAFVKNENKIKELLPDYEFVYGSIDQLKNPQFNDYILFGRTIPVSASGDQYTINDQEFDKIITDLKQQFQVYQLIFSQKNIAVNLNAGIQQLIDVVLYKKQVILQGPPGTGKTYTAKDIAEQILFEVVSDDKIKQKENLESSDQFKLIQFHPAYSYEDFVRGIVAKTNGSSIEYKSENKVLGNFAKEAFQNYLDSKKEINDLSKEKWLDKRFDEFLEKVEEDLAENGKYPLTKSAHIYEVEEDAFRYTGDNWSTLFRMPFTDIKKLYLLGVNERIEIKAQNEISGRAKQHATYYFNLLKKFKDFLTGETFQLEQAVKVPLKTYILIIDEINRANLPAVLGELIYALEYRGERVESMYSVDGDSKLVLPPNLYIIGTMNTSDRSVGHIDYAIRRRFAFIEVLPKVIQSASFQVDLFKTVTSLFVSNFDQYAQGQTVQLQRSEHLSEEFRPEDVWLGHSYFIENGYGFDIRKQYEIVPILKEYVKDGILKASAEEIINEL